MNENKIQIMDTNLRQIKKEVYERCSLEISSLEIEIEKNRWV